jgi:hypothetical protein
LEYTDIMRPHFQTALVEVLKNVTRWGMEANERKLPDFPAIASLLAKSAPEFLTFGLFLEFLGFLEALESGDDIASTLANKQTRHKSKELTKIESACGH